MRTALTRDRQSRSPGASTVLFHHNLMNGNELPPAPGPNAEITDNLP